MKALIYAGILLCLTLGNREMGFAQSDLDQLDQRLTRHIEKVLPGWKHKRGEPIVNSENVLIQFLVLISEERKNIGNAISLRGEAKAALAEFVKYEREKESLSGLADEAYGWGFAHSDIVFRRGKLVVYVSTRADAGAAPDERMLTQEERLEREKNQMVRWSREFAKHAAKAIDDQ